MSGMHRDRETGRVYPVDSKGREIEDPAIVEARQAAAELKAFVTETDEIYASASPTLKAIMDRADRSYWWAISEAARLAAADRAAKAAADVQAATGKDMDQLRALAAGGNQVAAAILAVREKALEDYAFSLEWSAEGLAMATRAGFSEERLREDFHKRYVAAGMGARPS